MIGRLTGLVVEIEQNALIVDVSGVGYEIFCSSNTLNYAVIDSEINLNIITHVREDHIHLYGFYNKIEKETFNILTKVSGVGTKMGIAILSALTPNQISSAVASQDKAAFTPVSGVGPKLANRLLTELKDKFKFDVGDDFAVSSSTNNKAINSSKNNINDAISALSNLGYSRSDSYSVIMNIATKNDNASLDFLIKEALKELSS